MTGLRTMKALVQTLIDQWIFMSVGIITQECTFVKGSVAANLHTLTLYASNVPHTLTSIS